MTGPAYPAARAVARTLEEHFARHIAAARAQGRQGLAPEPDAAAIEATVEAGFWASLRREEGYSPKISLAFLPPESAARPLVFDRRMPLAPASLTKLAPAVERPGIHLGVWRDGGGLYVWGATRAIPKFCFVLEVVEPGLLVVKYRRGLDAVKFSNVAVLSGDQVRVVDEGGSGLPDCPALVESLVGFGLPSADDDSVNALVQLAVSMREHKRGGTLLVVPETSEEWRESILQPVAYAIDPPHGELAELLEREAGAGRDGSDWREALRRAVDAVAGLTAVDGAALINRRFELLAFGAKIGRREGHMRVEQVILTEPVVGDVPSVVNPVLLGGTRHLSAAQFVQDQRDSVALVASQDGRFTVFAWSPCEGMVHAHRVEALLM
ncbi:MAG TPA: hypothetical protein VEY09_15275 [Pyrinomonadaceae bacterium]|nr:hypothetical protein [Pyrinomonadaceae bacterium]